MIPDPKILCSVCIEKYDRGDIERLEQLCGRCWTLIAPRVIPETESLLT